VISAIIILATLAGVSLVQNAAFTAVSRSRNAGDVGYHIRCAIASNGIWFITNFLVVGEVYKALETGSYWFLIAAGIVYVASTTAGSAWMMARLLKTEKGKRQVGAR
jgi:predicted permease